MELKEDIKQKLDIINVIGRYVELKKSGSNYKGLCPFHSENTPSFMVSPEMQIFKCFGCGKGGDIFTFLMEMEGVEFRDALNQLAEEADIDTSKYNFRKSSSNKSIYFEINEAAQKFYTYTLLKLDVGKKALNYLKERGLKEKHIEEFKLGYAPNSWNSINDYLTKKEYKQKDILKAGLIKKGRGNTYYDVYRGRIIFALENQGGKIVGFSGRTILDEEPKYINTKDTPVFNKSEFVYNLNRAKTDAKRKKEIVVTEGEFDAITPFIKGIKNITAIKGTSFTKGQAKLLKRYAETAYMFFDSDDAGNSAAIRGIQIAQNEGLNIKIATLPNKFKDPDEAAKKSIDIIYKSIDEAIPAYDYFFEYILKNNSPRDPFGKKKIAEFLKPKIEAITDKILKAHYSKKLAELINVREDELEIESSEAPARKKEQDNQKQNYNREENKNMLLVYMLRADKDIFEKHYKKVKEESLLSKEENKILDSYKNNVIDKDKNKKLFIEKNKEISEDLFLQNLGPFEESPNAQELTIQKLIQNKRKLKLKNNIKELTNEIKEAEKLSNRQKLDKLQKKFTMLTKELAKLK